MAGTDLEKAEILLELNRPREAADLAARIVAAEPGEPDGWILLAQSLESIGEPARALEMANRAIGLRPEDPEPHLISSRVLRTLKSYPFAIAAGEEAVRLAPMAAAAHVNLAITLASLGRGDLSLFGHLLPRHLRRAAEHAAYAVRLAPYSAPGYFASGFVASASGKRRLALENYRRVLAIDPQHAAAMNNIALIHLGRGRMTRGGAGFARALRADPSLKLARRNVTVTLRATAFLFHALWWLIYFCFSEVASTPETGTFGWRWGTRGEVALVLSGALGAAAVGVTCRMDPAVRSFARAMVANSLVIKVVLAADALTFGCFLISNVGHGAATGSWYLLGILGVGIAWMGFAISRSAHTR